MFESIPFLRAAALAADASLLAVAESGSPVRVWDPRTGTVVGELDSSTSSAGALSIRPDGHCVVAGRTVSLWELPGRLVRAVGSLPGKINAVSLNSTATAFAAGGELEEIHVWGISSEFQDYRFVAARLTSLGSRDVVRALAFIPGRNELISSTHTGEISKWQLEHLSRVDVLRQEGRPAQALAISSQGGVAAGDQAGVVRFWDHRGRQYAEVTGHIGPVVCVAFDESGQMVATGGDDRVVRVWDARSGEQVIALSGLNGRIEALAFSGEGDVIHACDGDAVVARWSLPDGSLLSRFRCRLSEKPFAVGPDQLRAWQREALRYDWESLRCGCSRGARHVPASFEALVNAQTDEEATGEGLIGDVEIQGLLFEAAVPVTGMIIAALAEEPLSMPARRRLLDLLSYFVDGESYHTESLEGRPDLELSCQEKARAGIPVLRREMAELQDPGLIGLIEEILDSLGE